MNFLKQLLFLLVLVSPVTCVPTDMPNECPLTISDDLKQGFSSIGKIIGKALEGEFDLDLVPRNGTLLDIDVNSVEVKQFFQQKLPVIADKFSNAVNALPKDEQSVVIMVLRDLQSFFSVARDVVKIVPEIFSEDILRAQECLPEEVLEELCKKMHEITEEFNKKSYEILGKLVNAKNLEEFILIKKELEKNFFSMRDKLLEEHDALLGKIEFTIQDAVLIKSFNLLSPKLTILSLNVSPDLMLITGIDFGSDKAALFLQKFCLHLYELLDNIANPENLMGIVCSCRNKEMQKILAEEVADRFSAANRVFSALLQSIENQ